MVCPFGSDSQVILFIMILFSEVHVSQSAIHHIYDIEFQWNFKVFMIVINSADVSEKNTKSPRFC